ncbi:saccharopine dehydrogenase family protein [Kineococcus arenarius]|uniref:saccharopine dehydrogenase n=1 Tax=unclassified Kineococcus TaxID=2621656 RepID=UPI003D7CFEC5
MIVEDGPVDVVVLGALGAVGRRVSGRLAPLLGRRLVIAGRGEERVRARAAELGARGAVVDVRDTAALLRVAAGARVAVLALEADDDAAARALLGAGVRLVDVGATPAHLARLEALDPLARGTGATAALSVGLAPGATNLLARAAHEAVGGAGRVAITVLLGAGERHGREGVRWTVDTLLDGAAGPARRVALPPASPSGRVRVRTAHPFAFADAPAVRASLGVADVTTRLALDPAAASAALFALGRLRGTAAGASPRVRAALVRALSGVHVGTREYAARADAWSPDGRAHAAFAVAGVEQTRATAEVAARTALALAAGDAPAGVHHLDRLPVGAGLLTDLAQGPEPVWRFLRLDETRG